MLYRLPTSRTHGGGLRLDMPWGEASIREWTIMKHVVIPMTYRLLIAISAVSTFGGICAVAVPAAEPSSIALSDDHKNSGSPARPGAKPVVDIGSRRELFVDDFLVDGIAGGAERRLHHPTPREVVLRLDQPWEGQASAYFAVVEDDGRILIYYNARPNYPDGGSQTTCVVESTDGVHFTRPKLGLIEFKGSKENNMLWRRGASGHNLTPFKDTNPAASAAERFKAIAYHPEGAGLGAYVSGDGIHWKLLVEDRIVAAVSDEGVRQGGFDSQNVAFWDAERKMYVCYYRGPGPDPEGKLRGIWRMTSDDFRTWTKPHPVAYSDDRPEHLYTNVIRPYVRAPHLYLGTPARYVPRRTKVPDHSQPGISDAVLMSTRDGRLFDRWEEGFLRPGTDLEVWTDRNNYPAWGMVQSSPEEISLYWTEHYRHPTMRLRRGTIRTDGFVSLHAGGKRGEVLTRPLVFAGDRLVVNYATSAIGSLRFGLCDPDGKPIKGYGVTDSKELFGNEVEHDVAWKSGGDLGKLAGRPVRLRIQLHDADLYSIRFSASSRSPETDP
jgi:hypothetical protein